ncbi:IS110 family transposase [Pseudonocardia humida]|uniref:IS110 family transposase n=1 Tax=Pseudonocardia humida TaxID=2800819 RepID=A0ABT1A660_9PSEU|nr:IS110 family transposase [Pseudonocardia humida]MCO1658517.1 IS110 family transposase [Pseudonocardia humida]
MITIGIDPHKSSLTAVALDPSGQIADSIRLPVDGAVVGQLLAWAQRWGPRRWAVEGAAGLGRGVAQGLAVAGECVVDVPAQLAARARLLDTGHARKTDAIDAASVAVVAQRSRRLHRVHPEDQSVVLRLLSERRDDLAGERVRVVNRLHALLRDLIPGGARRNLTAEQASALLDGVQAMTAPDAQRQQLAVDLVADLRRLDAALAANTTDIAAAVEAQASTLTQIHGIGPVLAAKIIGQTGVVQRFPTRYHYASYCGTAPIEASSGEQRRHRLSRAGNRQLNRALHLVAVCQIRTKSPGREFYQRKLAESKTAAEARRALKRRLCDTIYRHLTRDHLARQPQP